MDARKQQRMSALAEQIAMQLSVLECALQGARFEIRHTTANLLRKEQECVDRFKGASEHVGAAVAELSTLLYQLSMKT